MKIVLITSTRPDIIKMAPLYWEGKKKGHEMVIVHAAQHFPYSLFESFYKNLGLPFPPDHIVHSSAAKKVAVKLSRYSHKFDKKYKKNLTDKMEKFVSRISPDNPDLTESQISITNGLNQLFKNDLKDADITLVHGDTLTCMCGALTSYLNQRPVGHVEAGLRTFAKEPYPEEVNRRIADACSDFHFTHTKETQKNLLNEGFKDSVYLVGNTIVDATHWAAKRGDPQYLYDLGMEKGREWVYFTSHRRENFLSKKRVQEIMGAVYDLADMGYQVLWSNKPGNQRYYNKHGIKLKKHDDIIKVTGIPKYTDNIWFMNKCKLIVTDSGGMQEECAALKKPCITIRQVTERPETIEAGMNFLADPTKNLNIKTYVNKALKIKKWNSVYGKGNTAKKIFDVLEKEIT